MKCLKKKKSLRYPIAKSACCLMNCLDKENKKTKNQKLLMTECKAWHAGNRSG